MRRAVVCLGLVGLVYACGGGSSRPAPGAGGEPGNAAGQGFGESGAAGTSSSSGGQAGASEGGQAGESGAPNEQGGMRGEPQAGTAGEADTGGEAGAVDSPRVENPIVLENTHFVAYGLLRIAFTLPVQASSLSVSLSVSLSLAPELPSILMVSSVKQVDASTVDVVLVNYHQPRDYQLSVAGKLPDGREFEAGASLPGLGNGSRVAFVTKASGIGDIKSWGVAPIGALTARDAADAICQSEATDAGLRGTFVAFLSEHGKYDAGCRAFGLDGLLSAKCGQASAPTDTAPWLSPTGLPIINGASNLLTDNWLNAVSFYVDGSRVLGGVWHGTHPGAKASLSSTGDDCTGWTASTKAAAVTEFVGAYLLRFDEFASACSDPHQLMCLQVGGSFFGPGTQHQVSGRRVFVSKGTVSGAMSYTGKSGRDAADALCQAEAAAASYANSSKFHAYLGTSTSDALCHILGSEGKVGNRCGLGGFPTDSPWRRADNYPVGTAAQIAAAKLTAPIAFAPDGSAQLTQQAWTGTPMDGVATKTCSDWSSADAANEGVAGAPRALTNGFTYYLAGDCDTPRPLYCFEQ